VIGGRLVRLLGFILLMFITLAASTAFVILMISITGTLGLVVVRPIEMTSQSIVTAILGIAGLVGAAVAFDRTQIEARALRSRFAFDLTRTFFQDNGERDFFYKVEHETFVFDAEIFLHSEDEKNLDKILYKLSLIGKMLRDKTLEIDDIKFVRHIARSVIGDPQVQKYLAWLKKQVPDHASFADSIFLMERFFGRKDPMVIAARLYLK
jgi:hypothetical protein